MKVLITGVTGFCGSYLAEALSARGDEVWGICRHPERDENLASCRKKIRLSPCDLAQKDRIQSLLAEVRPAIVFHLAGESSTGRSLHQPDLTIQGAVTETTNLLEACRNVQEAHPDSIKKIVLLTSSEMYGVVSSEQIPLTEAVPPRPAHPYGVSKTCVHHIGRLYGTVYRLPVVEARAFNQIGPRQRLGFVLPDFAHQVAEITRGRRPPVIQVGALTDQRDFTDVRDGVRAFLLLAERGRVGEVYHICSGVAVPIQKILDTLLKEANHPIQVQVEASRLRPSHMPIIQGSFDKIRSETGWSPHIPLSTSIRDTLHYWQQHAGELS